MKLHKVPAFTEVAIRKVGTKEFTRYTTKEDKTYFAEEFKPPCTPKSKDYFNFYYHIDIDGKHKALTPHHYALIEKDGYEMLVDTRMIDMYCNLSD